MNFCRKCGKPATQQVRITDDRAMPVCDDHAEELAKIVEQSEGGVTILFYALQVFLCEVVD